jgi:hypothetical protein
MRPTLSTSNLGLWRLLIADILQLQEKDQLVVILSPTSRLLPIYKGFIQQQVRQTNGHLSQPSRLELADELLLKRHEFQCLGASYYVVQMTSIGSARGWGGGDQTVSNSFNNCLGLLYQVILRY